LLHQCPNRQPPGIGIRHHEQDWESDLDERTHEHQALRMRLPWLKRCRVERRKHIWSSQREAEPIAQRNRVQFRHAGKRIERWGATNDDPPSILSELAHAAAVFARRDQMQMA
jgi:hypothetical protein